MVLATLSNPGTFASAALNTFTVPGGVRLKPETPYWVTVNQGVQSGNRMNFRFDAGDEETGEPGWTIADGRLRRHQGNWSSRDTSLVMAVYGAAIGVPVAITSRYARIVPGQRNLVFLLTRGGGAQSHAFTLDATVTIDQDEDWLADENLSHTVTFAQQKREAELTLPASAFLANALPAGRLTAKVSGEGILGSSKTVRVLSDEPLLRLVSNHNQVPVEEFPWPYRIAQTFTSSSSTAYTLKRVRVERARATTTPPAMSVCPLDGHDFLLAATSTWMAMCTRLQSPDTVGERPLIYTATSTLAVASGTTYALVISQADPSAGNVDYGLTRQNNEDPGGAREWSLGNETYFTYENENDWFRENNPSRRYALRVALYGATTTPRTSTTTPANRSPMFATASTTRSVDENAPAGPLGAALTATDGDGDPLTYTLERGDGALFEVVGDSGELRTRTPLDHESAASHGVAVQADDGRGGTDTIEVTVSVEDVDEQPARPAAPTVTATENATDSVDVRWAAPGLNGGPAIVGYRLRYQVAETTGWTELTPTATSTMATIGGLSSGTEYAVQVRALNGETPSEWSMSGTGFTRAVQNTAPAFEDGDSAARSVDEDAPAGPLGAALTATDVDGDRLTYTLERGDATLFEVVGNSGQLRTRKRLDFESAASHVLTVKVADGKGGTDTIEVTVTVGDVDEPPDRPAAPSVNGVEDSPTSLSVRWREPANTGPPAEYDVRYREADGNADWADGPTTSATSATLGGLSPETRYEVQVRARNDEGESAWSASGIGNTGELAPSCDGIRIDNVTVHEGEVARFAIVFSPPFARDDTLNWWTRDVEARSTHGDFVAASGRVPLSPGATEVVGEVETRGDTETEPTEMFQISMDFDSWRQRTDWRDLGCAGRVFIRDGYGNAPPEFAEGAAATRRVDENTPPGQPVGKPVSADDPNDDPVTYTLEGPEAAMFRIDGKTGQLRTDGALDHEAQAEHRVTVRAADRRGDSSTIEVTVAVRDVNEPPATPAAPAVTAAPDVGGVLDVAWTKPGLAGGPEIVGYRLRFGARGSNGREEATRYPATARSGRIDKGLKADTEYWVRVRALNDEEPSDWSPPGFGRTGANRLPVFDEGAATSRSVAENTHKEKGAPVGAPVTATDPEGDNVRYGLEGRDADAFRIDYLDGHLKTRRAFDHESAASHVVTVTATDKYGSGGTATIEVTVHVTDVDEPPARPGRPHVFTVDGDGTRLRVNWPKVSNTGPPVVYDLRYKKRGAGDWTDGPQGVSGNSAKLGGLQPETEYRVQLRARNDEGESAWSVSGEGTTDANASGIGPDARVAGDVLTLRYPQALEAGSTPGPKDWVVRASTASGARTLAVTGVSVSGAEVALQLSPPASAGESVSVSYLPWAMHPLRGADGAALSPLTELAVRNDTPPALPGVGVDGAADPGVADDGANAPALERHVPLRAAALPAGPATRLDLKGLGLTEVSALALLAEPEALQVLDLSGNRIADAWPLAGLGGLRRLNLADNRLADIAALAALGGLEVLDLRGNAVSDAWPLAGLAGLRRVDLSGNRLNRVAALAGLAELEVLVLDGNRIADVWPLALLPRLARLDLSGNRVSDAALLAKLRSLARLDLAGNRVADAGPLGDLSALVWLDLTGNPISDVAPLGRLTALRWLWLDADAPPAGMPPFAPERPAPLRVLRRPPAAP